METSPEIKNLALALSKFQSEMHNLDLNREVKVQTKSGGTYSFKYATFANGVDEIRPILFKNGLCFSQILESDSSVTTIIIHNSGEWLSGNLLLKTNEQTAQSIGSMITYAKRYSLFSALGIVAEDDDDGNAATGNNIQQSTDKPKQEDGKPWLNPKTEQWTKAVSYLKDGGLIFDIEKKYKISKENKDKLIQEAI